MPYAVVQVRPLEQGYAHIAHTAAAAIASSTGLDSSFRAQRMLALVQRARTESTQIVGGPAYNLMQEAYRRVPERSRGAYSTLGAIDNLERWLAHPKHISPVQRRQVRAFLVALEAVSLEIRAA